MAGIELVLTGRDLTPATLAQAAGGALEIRLAPQALERMAAGHRVVARLLAENRPVYGLNTGLGARVGHRLPVETLADFSRLTVRGRSNAVGPPLPPEMARAVMIVRLNGLLLGGSGAAPGVAESLASVVNAGLVPLIPAIGSIGAGDLCVLAHLALALIGEGRFLVDGEPRPAAATLAGAGLEPLVLGPKDGLAICNASAFSAARSALALDAAEQLLAAAQIAAALSLEGFRGNLTPLDPRIVAARPAPGQQEAAAGLLRLLDGGALLEPGAARRLQDPISLRCVAQVHGSLIAALGFARPAVEAELNGAADNPLVLIDDQEILSTGNFHTPALALAMETLGQALAQTAALSVGRSVRLLVERHSGLPANLTRHGPTQSGFAPLTKVAEALLQEIRHQSLPAPLELRAGADGVEDDLTNAPLAAGKVLEIVWRMRLVLAIELLVAAQAIDLAAVARLGRGTEAAHQAVRGSVASLDQDRPHGLDVEALQAALLESGRLVRLVREAAP